MFIIKAKVCKNLGEIMDYIGCSGYEVNRAYEASWGEKYMYVADKTFRKVHTDTRIVYVLEDGNYYGSK